jgi:hypothetical protein
MSVLKPGEYPCVVHHPTAGNLPGTAELCPGRDPVVHVYDWPIVASGGVTSFPGPEEQLATARCELRQGVDLILFDAVVQPWLPEHAWMSSSLALAAPPGFVEPDTRFFEARLQITHGHRVFGTFPIHAVEWPSQPATTGTDRYSVHWDADAITRFPLGGVDLRAEFLISHSIGDRYQFSLQSRPVFTLTSEAARSPAEWMRDYLEPLRDLVSLATLEPQRIAIASVGSPDNDERERPLDYTLFSRAIDQEAYSPSIDTRNDGRTLFTFRDAIGNPLELLSRWQQLQRDSSAFVEPLLAGLTQPASPRVHFLALVQALEGLHAEQHGEGRIPVEDHRARRTSVLEEVGRAGISDESLDWLKAWIDRYGRYSLRERLDQLATEVADDIGPIAGAQLEARRIAEIRNGLSHGSRKYSGDELQPHLRAMAVVGIAHLLRLLEVPPGNIERFFP